MKILTLKNQMLKSKVFFMCAALILGGFLIAGTVSAASVGPLNPYGISETNTSDVNWDRIWHCTASFPWGGCYDGYYTYSRDNVKVSDNQYATVSLDNYETSEYIKAANFGFAIPTSATINGIVVEIERKANHDSGDTCWGGSHYSPVRTEEVKLINASGSITSTNKAPGSNYTKSDAYESYGSSSDSWGETLTRDYINDTDFGVAIRVEKNGSGCGDVIASIDHVRMTVYYTLDTTAPTSSVTYPTEGAILKGTIEVTADASDSESGVNSVIFHRASDPTIIGTDTTAPYSAFWNTTDVADGDHSVWVDTYDNAGNHATSTSVNVVVDNTAPVITAPANQEFEATGPMTTPTLTPATATDNIDTDVAIDYSPKDFALGTWEVTWTATDDAGNVSTATSSVTIFGNNPFDLYINEHYHDYISEPDYSAIDLVDGDLTGTESVTVEGKEDLDNGTKNGELGLYSITYTAVDYSGNTSSITYRAVYVVEKNKPIIYRTGPSPVTVERGSTYTDEGATAVDRDGSDITEDIITNNPVDSNVVGNYTVTYDVTGADIGDNTGTSTADQAIRVVNVVDTVSPTATISYSETATTTDDVVATLVPSEPVTVTNNGGSDSYTFTSNGDFTFEFVDGSGNTGSTTAIVANIDRQAPGVVAPVIATTPTTVEITFDEELMNNEGEEDGHSPKIEDFCVYRGGFELATALLVEDLTPEYILRCDRGSHPIEITGISYADKVVILTLAEPFEVGDEPTYEILPVDFRANIDNTIVDLYYNFLSEIIAGPIVDRILPVLTLNGDNPMNLNVGESYSEPGATASDILDGNLTEAIEISGTVDTGTAGTYTVNYSVTDAALNTATSTRTVNVNGTSGSLLGGAFMNGGSVTVHPCTEVTYSDWGTCNNGMQYRNILTQLPALCNLTLAQQNAAARSCGGAVLGVKFYPDGSLLRSLTTHRIYYIIDGKKKYIRNFIELWQYRGIPIINVGDDVLAQYPDYIGDVLGVKVYPDGSLLRSILTRKIYYIMNAEKLYIKNLVELWKYRGIPIINVAEEILAQYPDAK
jgi:hypothetical protein